MVLTQIGEIGISCEGRDYILRPSLYAMTRLGEPKEIVDVYASVMSELPHPAQFTDALAVIYACCDEDLSPVFGAHEIDDEKVRYAPGAAPVEHVLPVARCLLRHGVTGALPPLPIKPDQRPEYVKEFDARANVSMAIAHLGMSSADAWQMTMTELVGALRAKFPETESASGARAPTLEEHDATMEWFERVDAARKARN